MGEKSIAMSKTVEINGVLFSHSDISTVIDHFYGRVQRDSILQVPFKSVEDWPEHVKNITHFWWIKFGGSAYMFSQYNPVPKHFFAGFSRDLLKRWLLIFHETLHAHLTSDQAALWIAISTSMGESLAIKNDHYKMIYESQIGSG